METFEQLKQRAQAALNASLEIREQLETYRKAETQKANALYAEFIRLGNEAYLLENGEPYLEAGMEIMVTEGGFVRVNALQNADNLVHRGDRIPEAGEIGIVIQNPHFQAKQIQVRGDGWVSFHVPYADAQDMRRAYLEVVATH